MGSYDEWSVFYDTDEWNDVRLATLRRYGRKCMCCGATNTELHVDHIKPRSRYPHLSLDPDNLQVLCKTCNYAKRSKVIDYRHGPIPKHVPVPPQLYPPFWKAAMVTAALFVLLWMVGG